MPKKTMPAYAAMFQNAIITPDEIRDLEDWISPNDFAARLWDAHIGITQGDLTINQARNNLGLSPI